MKALLAITLAASLLIAAVPFVENHNSSRSNKSYACWHGDPNAGGEILVATLKRMQVEIDAMPAGQVNERSLRALLVKYGESKKVAKIVVEPGAGGLLRIMLLQAPAMEANARARAVMGEKQAA